MNKANETIGVKKMPKYQMLKAKMQQKVMHVLTVSIVLGIGAVSNASASANNSTIDFSGVTDTIESVVPIFGALQGLIVAVFPYFVVVTFATGIILLFKLLASDLNLK